MIDGLVIDSFAGGGGASTGIEMAFARALSEGLIAAPRFVDYAINHDVEAIAMHTANHPHTEHLPCNIWSVEFDQLVGRRKVALMWFSPDCKHFSKAKGGKPVKKTIRDLAWVVVKAARQVRPAVIMLENVEEFQSWGPLMFKRGGDGEPGATVNLFQASEGARPGIPANVMRDDKTGEPVLVPDPERKGQTFRQWTAELERLGYHIEWRELRACDYGAPTIRKRFFMIARRDGRQIVWPEPTHGDPKSEAVKSGKLLPWRTAAEIIDWSLPCPSIFLTKEEGRALKVKRPLENATMARIAKGVKRYVLDAEKPFIVNLTHHGVDRTEDIDEPVKTVTGAHRGEKAVVAPVFAGVGGRAGQSPPRSGDMPTGTLTAKADIGLVVPTLITTGYGERDGQEPRVPGLDKPLGTAVAGGIKHAVVGASIIRTDQTSAIRAGVADADAPLRTATTGSSFAVVEPTLTPFASYAQQGGATRSLEEPLHTLTASLKDQNQVIAPVVVRTAHGERDKTGKKRGRGDHAADGPLPTVTASPEFGVMAPHLTKFRANSIGSGMDEPAPTVTANSFIKRPGGAPPMGVVAAFLAQHNIDGRSGEGNAGRAASEPVSTVLSSGSHQSVLATHMLDMHGSDMRASPSDEPVRTLTAQGFHAAQVVAFLTKYYGTGDGAVLSDPMHTTTTKDRFGLVTALVDGIEHVIVDINVTGGTVRYAMSDIGMRMLIARELFNAQSFPKNYIIDRGLFRLADGSFEWRPLTKTAQIRMCGNSVCPVLADALAYANVVQDTGFRVTRDRGPSPLDFPLWQEEAA